MYNEKHNKFTTVYKKLCNKSKAYNKLTTCWKYCGFVATNWQQLVHNQSTAFRQIHSKLYDKSTANQSNGIWANVAETTQIKQTTAGNNRMMAGPVPRSKQCSMNPSLRLRETKSPPRCVEYPL